MRGNERLGYVQRKKSRITYIGGEWDEGGGGGVPRKLLLILG